MSSPFPTALCAILLFAANAAGAQGFHCPPGECQPNAKTVPPNDSAAGLAGGGAAKPNPLFQISPRERQQDRIAHSLCSDPAC